MIDFQAVQEAAKMATASGGSKLLEGGIGGAVAVAFLRVAEAAIQKWRPRKNGNSKDKPGTATECIEQGNRLTALETDQKTTNGLLKEVRDDVKDILRRLP